jgi:hypothetical protein
MHARVVDPDATSGVARTAPVSILTGAEPPGHGSSPMRVMRIRRDVLNLRERPTVSRCEVTQS